MLAGVSVSHAIVFAYEGFDSPNYTLLPGTPVTPDTTLDLVAASGSGWTGGWTVSNGNSADSVYQSAGLSFPASYPGTFTAVGGNGLNKGNGSNSMLRLNFDPATATAVNSSGVVYVSFLGQHTAPVTPPNGVTGAFTDERYQNPYPRNAGVRFVNVDSANHNNSMGMIGMNGSNAENNGWGTWGWKDTHAIMSGADMRDNPDFVVVELDFTNSHVQYWINPQADGTAEGMHSFDYTDGGTPVVMALYGFGVEAGSNSSDRQPGEWVFDEIRVASSFDEAAGFTMVPEPSTYAAILGFLALAFVYVRRRRNK